MQSIDSILREADAIFEKRAASKAPVKPTYSDSDDAEVVKLANFLATDGDIQMETTIKTASASTEETPFEKVAHALAIVETLMNIEQLQKLSDFEKTAEAKGYSEAQIEDFMEKQALKPIHKFVGGAALAGLAGGALEVHGRKKGYDKALGDVSRAMNGQGSSEE